MEIYQSFFCYQSAGFSIATIYFKHPKIVNPSIVHLQGVRCKMDRREVTLQQHSLSPTAWPSDTTHGQECLRVKQILIWQNFDGTNTFAQRLSIPHCQLGYISSDLAPHIVLLEGTLPNNYTSESMQHHIDSVMYILTHLLQGRTQPYGPIIYIFGKIRWRPLRATFSFQSSTTKVNYNRTVEMTVKSRYVLMTLKMLSCMRTCTSLSSSRMVYNIMRAQQVAGCDSKGEI